MPTYTVTEYVKSGVTTGGLPTMVGQEKAIAIQSAAFDATNTTLTFNAKTTLIRLHVDADCNILFGDSTVDVTSGNTTPVDTNASPEYFGVHKALTMAIRTR